MNELSKNSNNLLNEVVIKINKCCSCRLVFDDDERCNDCNLFQENMLSISIEKTSIHKDDSMFVKIHRFLITVISK